jgi:GTPase SAR1 family protein
MDHSSQPKDPAKHSYLELAHRKTLIIGEISTGKTSLTSRLLTEALQTENPKDITVIDMAPEKTIHRGKPIGGRIADTIKLPSAVRVLQPSGINPPRYSAKSKEELLKLVEENRRAIEEILDIYLDRPTPILFINDLSIYLQSGSWMKILDAMNRSDTFIANAYYGEALKEDLGTGVSEVEKRLVEKLSNRVDFIIKL